MEHVQEMDRLEDQVEVLDEDVLLVTILQRALVENPIRVRNLNLHPVLIVQENTHLKDMPFK